VTAVILAGGRSQRMGVDKTQMELGGQTLLLHVVEALYPLAGQTIIVTNRPEELPLDKLPDDIVVTTDEVAYQGPLGGLVTACSHVENEWILSSAADMPWINADIVNYLCAQCAEHDVVIPVGPQGPEPLLALYRVEAIEPAGRKVLTSGRRRIVAMFDELDVKEIARSELEAIDPGLATFFNINTQADFSQAQSRMRKSSHDEVVDAHAELSDVHEECTSPKKVRVMSLLEAGRKMPSETPITIYLNGVEIATVQATATDIGDMALGFLLAEGLVSDRSLFDGLDLDAKRGLVYVRSHEEVPLDLIHGTRYVTSGCGKGVTFSSLGHARGIEPIDSDMTVDAADLHEWMSQLATRSVEYRQRGGCHSCGMVIDGELVLVREDIGRHNAVDKLLGHAWLEGIDTSRSVLLSSGRVSYEMIVKAAKSRVPFVASRSAATDLAAEIADELKITLAGYVRGGKAIVYTHPQRLIDTTR